MVPLQIQSGKKFYKVDIADITSDGITTNMSLISKIWHVGIGKHPSSFMQCRIETFRREHNDNIMLQSEKDLWGKLALINDDVTILLDNQGQPIEIVNLQNLKQKSLDMCNLIREIYKGNFIENLLADVETLYNDPSGLLQEFKQYKQFGLLTHGLYNNDLNTVIRPHRLNFHLSPFNTGVSECFSKDAADEDGFINFTMQGTVTNIHEQMPTLNSYSGKFSFENEKGCLHKADIEITYSVSNYQKKRKSRGGLPS